MSCSTPLGMAWVWPGVRIESLWVMVFATPLKTCFLELSGLACSVRKGSELGKDGEDPEAGSPSGCDICGDVGSKRVGPGDLGDRCCSMRLRSAPFRKSALALSSSTIVDHSFWFDLITLTANCMPGMTSATDSNNGPAKTFMKPICDWASFCMLPKSGGPPKRVVGMWTSLSISPWRANSNCRISHHLRAMSKGRVCEC